MTWYANYILATPKPETISKFCAVPELSGGLYVVKELDDYAWFDERVRHGLPPEGVLVGREVGNFASHAAEWHRTDFISWNTIHGPDTYEVIQPEYVITYEDDPSEIAHLEEALPPIEFLRFLKWINETSGSVVSFYYCVTWGGDIEEEFAWIFSDEDRVYRFRDNDTTFEFHRDGSREVVEGAVLNLTLSHYDLILPSAYFALCSRSFNWDRYRINCE